MATEATATPDDTGAETTETTQDSTIETQETESQTENDQTTESDINGDVDSDSDSATNTDTDDVEDDDDDDDDDDLFDYDEVMSEYSEFAVPEGTDQALVDGILKELAPILDEIAADQDDAQLLLNRELERAAGESQRSSDEWAVQLKQWDSEIANDREIGGEHLAQSKGFVTAALKQFGGEEVSTMLTDLGLVQQPAMFKFLRSIGAAMKEDNPGGGLRQNGGPKDRVSTLYPK